MGMIKNLWMDIAGEIQAITGNSYDECLEIARPLADIVLRTGTCVLPDGSVFPKLFPKWERKEGEPELFVDKLEQAHKGEA